MPVPVKSVGITLVMERVTEGGWVRKGGRPTVGKAVVSNITFLSDSESLLALCCCLLFRTTLGLQEVSHDVPKHNRVHYSLKEQGPLISFYFINKFTLRTFHVT